MTNAATQRPDANPERRTPFSARGEPRVWLMAMAVIVCLLMIVGITGLIVVRGAATFWPGPIHEVRLRDGTVFLGVPKQTETYTPQTDEIPLIEAARSSGTPMIEGAFTDDDRTRRRRYFVGNRDLGQESYRWVPLWTVASIEQPADALVVERLEWGPFLGRAESLEVIGDDGLPSTEPLPEAQAGIDRLQQAVAQMQTRRASIEQIDRVSIPRLVNETRELDLRLKKAQLRRDRALHPQFAPLPRWIWWAALLIAPLSIIGLRLWRPRTARPSSPAHAILRLACIILFLASGLYLWLERPNTQSAITDAQIAEIAARTEADRARINAEQETLLARLQELRADDARYRVRIVEPQQSRFSPSSRSAPDDPMLVSQIVRVVPGNRLGLPGRIAVYTSRWWEFLSTNPREGAVAGGVFPVIVGTVTLTLLLTISVVPLGVIAALYLREYARQGLVTSIIRIAINNLAGVPSIVYGMFGLGFFCYTLGAYIDAGPKEPGSPVEWWGLIAVMLLVVFLAAAMGLAARRPVGDDRSGRKRLLPLAASAAWLLAAGMAFWLIASTPYFGGFFAAKLPEQTTFGGRGILWAALTLALLTLPVVIVATEEAIAAVPGSMREGSYGCGASKWQTIRSIVLPAAMPGILTGAILAMARGAGEVAPLMLVGAVNLAPALPVSTDFPFLHGDRTFMHLGFHIYTLGFQSPDSEATEPLVWTTTLLLITIVLLLNLVAIVVRAKLRSRMKTSAV